MRLSEQARDFLTVGAAMLVVLLATLMCSCASHRQVEVVERVRTDTVCIVQLQRDSIALHDSVHVTDRQRGDTIYVTVERWRTQYRDRARTDTIRIHQVDSIPVIREVEVVKEVERRASWVEKGLMWLGVAGIVALLLKLKGLIR